MSVRMLHAADLHLDSPFEALSGAQAAQRILQANGITDVRIEHISGKLTDERFRKLSQDYEDEQGGLKAQVLLLRINYR